MGDSKDEEPLRHGGVAATHVQHMSRTTSYFLGCDCFLSSCATAVASARRLLTLNPFIFINNHYALPDSR